MFDTEKLQLQQIINHLKGAIHPLQEQLHHAEHQLYLIREMEESEKRARREAEEAKKLLKLRLKLAAGPEWMKEKLRAAPTRDFNKAYGNEALDWISKILGETIWALSDGEERNLIQTIRILCTEIRQDRKETWLSSHPATL